LHSTERVPVPVPVPVASPCLCCSIKCDSTVTIYISTLDKCRGLNVSKQSSVHGDEKTLNVVASRFLFATTQHVLKLYSEHEV
jgi:hypothetical protein